jgi:SNF2 family DNA or RNA helicase
VVACLGNRDAAERLIQYEIDKNPSVSWEAAARAALARIKRDNH